MPTYDRYPAVDENYKFPKPVLDALSQSPEIFEATRLTTYVDANELINSGQYYIKYAGEAASSTNFPETSAGTTDVVATDDKFYIWQIWRRYTGSQMYIRVRNNGAWSEWVRLATTDQVDAVSAEVAKKANSSDVDSRFNSVESVLDSKQNVEGIELKLENLNTITTPGTYTQGNTAEASLDLNYPVAIAGYLDVRAVLNRTQVYQMYRSFDGLGVYFRVLRTNGVWTAWDKVVFESDSDVTLLSQEHLNDVRTTGVFYQLSRTNSSLDNGYPVANAGRLIVTTPNSDMVQHEYTVYSVGVPRKWIRNYYRGAWGDWEQIVDNRTLTAGLNTKVDKTDPRLTDSRTPKYHTHELRDVAGLEDALNSKAALSDLSNISNAYQVATLEGYTGTVSEWLASLKGDRGDEGPYGGTAVTDPQVSSYVTTPDSETRLALDARYLRSVKLSEFGAVGDGVADDTLAIIRALESKQPLYWGDNTKRYRITEPIVENLTDSLIWSGDGAVILGDTPVGTEYLMTIHAQGHNVSIEGITIDSDRTSHTCIRIWNREGYSKLKAVDLGLSNAYRVVQELKGGNGIEIGGQWERISLVRPTVRNILMAPGAGVLGSYGVSGIYIGDINRSDGSAETPFLVTIDDPDIENVYSEDPTYLVDQDGIRIFAGHRTPDHSGPIDTQYLVRGGRIKNSRGRAIKSQAHLTTVDGLVVHRTEGGEGVAPEIDFQVGGGVARNIECVYENGNIPKTVVNFSGTRDAGTVTPQRQVSGLKVVTRGSANIGRLIATLSSGENEPLTTVSDVSAYGTPPMRFILMSSGSGNTPSLVMSNLLGAPVDAMIGLAGGSSEEGGWNGKIAVSSAINTGPTVPLLVQTTLAKATVEAAAIMGYTI